MPRNETPVEGTEGTDVPARAKRARKNGVRRPRASKNGFVAIIEIETAASGLADVSQFVQSLNAEGKVARLADVREKQ